MAGLIQAPNWYCEPLRREGPCLALIVLVQSGIKHHAKRSSERLEMFERENWHQAPFTPCDLQETGMV
jgi:hypothetical protein